MGAGPKEIDAALATVQRLLDRLTSRGQHEAAFEIARAQFSASMRASWPANLSAISNAIDKALAGADLSLTDQERAELAEAAAVLRSVPHE